MVLFRKYDMRKFGVICVLGILLLAISGCVYYNTFYHAKQAFNRAEGTRKGNKVGGRENISRADYSRARDKSAKVIEDYPTSKYYDDALFVNGVSNYYLQDFTRAERRFREILANYPESEFARDSRLYLAKTKLKLEDMAEARALFEKIFDESKEKDVQVEAALALGEYYFENKEYEKSREYFNTIIDSLGNDEDKKLAIMYNADGYFSRFQFKQALENYQRVLNLNPTTDEKYLAIFQSGKAHYFLNKIDEGMAEFQTLADDPLYYDSLGTLKLKIAEGFELDNDLDLAEGIYQEVATEFPDKAAGAVANYNLGLIYQYDYEDYAEAKEYYDKAKVRTAGEDIYQDALQRSANIGKLEDYKERVELDTSATQAQIDSAAFTQYLLGELYLFQLDKPDSAYQEFQYIVENFPTADYAPKAMIASALLTRDQFEDTLSCDSMLRDILKKYPHSDYIPEVIDLLGLAGTRADTGYPLYYFRKAENFAFDIKQYDSAKYYYEYVADSFPNSRLATKAKFASIWVIDEFANPGGDSSIYYAYSDFIDSFPRSEFAQMADRKINVPERIRREDREESGEELAVTEEEGYAIDVNDLSNPENAESDDDVITPEERIRMRDGEILPEVEQGPYRCDEEFIYPPSAYASAFEGDLLYQIKLDAFGEISDFQLMTTSGVKELDEVVTEVLRNCHWNTGWMEPEQYNTWFIYKYRVILPSSQQ